MSNDISAPPKLGGNSNPETLITAKELAERLSVSERTVRRLDAAGVLPDPVRIGGSVRWCSEGINRWIKAGCPSRDAWARMNKVTLAGGKF